MKKIAFALVLMATAAVAAILPAIAQDAPAKVEQNWYMISRLASPIAVAATTSPTALPLGGLVMWACNTGSNDAYLALGHTDTISVTVANGSWLKASTCAAYDLYPLGASVPYSYIATIGSGGTTTVYVETGLGTPPPSLASSGGGGGGAVFGPTAAGSAAATPPVLIGGTADGTATGNVTNWKILAGIGYINCSNCSGSGISVTFGGGIGTVGTPGGFKDGSGNFQPLLGDVTNGQWVNVKTSVLPTGAASAANQSTEITALGTINTTLGSPFQAGGSIGNTSFAVTQSTSSNLKAQVNVASGGIAAGAIASGAFVSGSVLSGAYAAGSIASGAMVDLGAQADSACSTDNGSCSLIALQKRGNQNLTTLNTTAGSAIPSGTNLIGQVSLNIAAAANSATNGIYTNLLQGNTVNSLTNPIFDEITDGTTGITIKPASTTATTSDTALVTALRPATPMTPIAAAASDNHAVIKNGAGTAFSVHASNNSATANYARLYDAGTGFNGCNSATGVIFAFEIPPSNSGFSIQLGGSRGIAFTNGLSFCITSGFGLTDTTNATASAIYFNASYN